MEETKGLTQENPNKIDVKGQNVEVKPDEENFLDLDFGNNDNKTNQSSTTNQNLSTHQNSDFDFFDQQPDPTTSPHKIIQNKDLPKASIFENDDNDFNIMDMDFSKVEQPKMNNSSDQKVSRPGIFDIKTPKSAVNEIEFLYYDLDPSDFQNDWVSFTIKFDK